MRVSSRFSSREFVSRAHHRILKQGCPKVFQEDGVPLILLFLLLDHYASIVFWKESQIHLVHKDWSTWHCSAAGSLLGS